MEPIFSTLSYLSSIFTASHKSQQIRFSPKYFVQCVLELRNVKTDIQSFYFAIFMTAFTCYR